MTINILTTNESMFWTDQGLRKPSELNIKDLILGVDTSGDIGWREVTQCAKNYGSADCIQIISNLTEILAPPSIVLCIQSISRRFSKIEEIKRHDKLRVISNPAYVLERWACKKEYDLSVDLAFLLGVAYRRVIFDEEKVVIKVPTTRIDVVTRTLGKIGFPEKFLDRIELSVEHGPIVMKRRSPWSWLIIKSKEFSSFIKSAGGDAREAPLAVRSNLELYRSYVYGLMQVLGQKEYEFISFETFLDEYDARKLLYNIFFLYAIECKTNAKPSYSPDKIVMSVKESELKRVLEKPASGLRGKKSVSKVRWIEKCRAPTCYVRIAGINWSPIVDLVYIL